MAVAAEVPKDGKLVPNPYELKEDYTVIIVIHNIQEAARVSDITAFFYLGELIEVDSTKKIFSNPDKKRTQDYIAGRFG